MNNSSKDSLAENDSSFCLSYGKLQSNVKIMKIETFQANFVECGSDSLKIKIKLNTKNDKSGQKVCNKVKLDKSVGSEVKELDEKTELSEKGFDPLDLCVAQIDEKTNDTIQQQCEPTNQIRPPIPPVQIHTDIKAFTCPLCKKTFAKKNYLRDHEKLHSLIRPYTCDVCTRSFNRKSYLKTHMLIHTGEKPYECQICKKTFRQKNEIEKHKLIHSGEKPHACDQCDKKFRQNSCLVKHKRTHSGERPYACDLCSKAFVQKNNLVEHRRIHTGERPYTCDLCKKSFGYKSHLNRHKLKHKK